MENSVKYKWYKAIVSTKRWNEWYLKLPTHYTFLSGDKKQVEIGFLAVIPPKDCLEITNLEDLRKIDLHMRSVNSHPFVFNDKKVK